MDEPGALSGRKMEAKRFGPFISATSSAQARALLISGGLGIGKSSLMRFLSREARGAGMEAPLIKVERGESEASVAKKAYDEYRISGDARMEKGAPESLGGLARALGLSKSGFGTIVFIDDLDRMRKAEDALASVDDALREGWGNARVSFVFSSTREMRFQGGLIERVPLEPFSEHEARELIEKALGKGPPKMGDECLNSVLLDSGGNPRLLKSVCYSIYERLRENEKVISKGHYLAYLPQIMSSLSREWFGGMYQETPPSERAILHALAKSEEGMHVSDIAKRIGKPLGPVTALVKRLLDRGQITRLGRGRYRIFSRLYGRYILQRAQ